MTGPEAWLRRQATLRPEAPALVSGGHEVSYAALDRHIDALARTLPRERVIGCAGSDALMLALAAPRVGSAVHPGGPPTPTGKGPGPIQLIIATSGSTGAPKGAMLTGATLAAAVTGSRARLGLEPGDVWLGCLPMQHIGGLSLVFRCLEAGATALLHDRFEAGAVGEDLAAGRASHVSLVPAMLARLLDLGVRPSPRLRCALVGGAALPAALAERALAAGWPLYPTYGMSEAASQVATCGEPLPGLEVDCSTGRIRLRGPSVMVGYYNPELRPGDGLDSEGWFETGDMGRFDAEGRLIVLGRADDILISGGENIHPIEVENLCGRCPEVAAVGISARPDPVWGDRLVAVVVGEVTPEVFLGWCREALPSHLRPRAMVRAEALPLSPGGKIDRKALRLMVAG